MATIKINMNEIGKFKIESNGKCVIAVAGIILSVEGNSISLESDCEEKVRDEKFYADEDVIYGYELGRSNK